MAQLKELHTRTDLEQALENSVQKPIYLFKHSITCPISADAFGKYQSFLKSAGDDVDYYKVVVSEARDVSNEIAEVTNVQHQSPQILLIKNKEALWHTSHTKITAESLQEALDKEIN